MAHYSTRHPGRGSNEEATVFTPDQLDPKLDEIVQLLGQEVAAHSVSESGDAHSQGRPEPRLQTVLQSHRTSITLSLFSGSTLLGLGIVGFALRLPSLQIGQVRFDLAFLLVSAFCTTLGGGCVMLANMAGRFSRGKTLTLQQARNRQYQEWFLGTLGIFFLVTASIVAAAYRQETVLLPTVFRLGVLGLTSATLCLQMQFTRLVYQQLPVQR